MIVAQLINRFRTREDGAVTVDWVVLTAAVVGLGIVALTLIAPSTKVMSEIIADRISTASNIPTT